ncbi:uncharacterized protein L969DRAFT_24831 [Mixia osmundae IAM 14324]|uniref:uncharacterized protein n=1 Tax=Mixia osmundae (strain CBS 9802 / IAM 14324 / JCM 22182 / KY 12970) TaxID=764103 RepID=UPI0004A5537E|nr:uncharacterized protein L969DRAFT_24831 [Mixia osmundae IAM 14324]KEI38351.1 hypothetical protein L969DRAFT_24831 [Mixia osmundae IAM 14324]
MRFLFTVAVGLCLAATALAAAVDTSNETNDILAASATDSDAAGFVGTRDRTLKEQKAKKHKHEKSKWKKEDSDDRTRVIQRVPL